MTIPMRKRKGEVMSRIRNYSIQTIPWRLLAVSLAALLAAACSQQPVRESSESSTSSAAATVKMVPAGQDNSGFLQDYSKLEPHPTIEGAQTYVNPDELNDLNDYVAMIVDPVEVYIASDGDPASISEEGLAAVTGYFQYAITSAVADAFPIVDEPNPLALRLRSALVGVDVGEGPAAVEISEETGEALARSINVSEVIVEFELVDSESGEVIAAAVDTAKLGSGAEVGTTHFSRMERFEAAKAAFDEWASRLRDFLDAEHEIEGGPDEERASESYQPYGPS